jgi:basic membrane protein A
MEEETCVFLGWVTLSLDRGLVLAACAPQAAAPAPAQPAAEQLRARGEAPRRRTDPRRDHHAEPRSDMAWSQTMYDALKELQAEMGEDKLQISPTPRTCSTCADAAVAIRDYATDGKHRDRARHAVRRLADGRCARLPGSQLCLGHLDAHRRGGQGIANIFAYEPRKDQAGYVTGVLAAKLNQTKAIGWLVRSMRATPSCTSMASWPASRRPTRCEGQRLLHRLLWRHGAGRRSRQHHIKAGADVLTGSSQQVVGAIGVATENNVPWIGVQADQSTAAPETVMASAVYDWKQLLKDIFAKRAAGTLGGEVLQLTYANGGIRTVYNEAAPAEAVEAAKAAEAGLADGSITIVVEPR